MKGWLARAEANTVLRGEHGVRITRWSRWFRRTGPVAERNFQGPEDPYPRHWHHPPEPWPPTFPTDSTVRRHLRHALDELPTTWRAVVDRHDVAGHSDTDVAHELGITPEQERTIRTQARAALRDQLAALLDRRGNQ